MVKDFKLVSEKPVEELRMKAFLFIHEPTKAEILLLKCSDENKVFGITFKTPPPNSTGLPHILEHAVLCGSKKYPVKEPFVELLKGSLHTFLNAFTYPDKTCYPVASTHPKDIKNLIDVYLDAVFNPLITPEIFYQEGWHYHKETPESPIEIRGVVYNEMKGAYSSPDRILMETVQQSLFPEHPYSLDSGGDPKEIPKLTYEDFLNFHKLYYHPSNSKIFFYGDGDIEEELALIKPYLENYSYISVPSDIPTVKPLNGMKIVEKYYGAPRGSGENQVFATINCLLTESTNIELNFAFQVLHYILLGMPGSPLRKALIESGLGEDLAGVGLETELKYLYFSTGLRGMREEKVGDMVSLFNETLEKLVKEGIPSSTIEASLNTIEFRYRECNTGSYPRGLFLMLASLTTWLYGGDPLGLIAFRNPIGRLKEKVNSDKFYFSKLIETYLLENPHKTLVVLKPDEDLPEVMGKEERAFIENSLRELGEKEINDIIEKTCRLKKYQETPDPPENLKKIPRLERTDLTTKVTPISKEVEKTEKGATLFIHPIETYGITYLDLGFTIDHIEEELLPYLPIFGTALIEMGTTKEDYVTFSEKISSLTGGIKPRIILKNSFTENGGLHALFLSGKSLTEKFPKLVEIFSDILTESIFDSKERLLQIIQKHKAKLYQKLIPEGHRMMLKRVKAHFTKTDGLGELLSGISQYMALKEMVENFEERWTTIKDSLYSLREKLFKSSNAIVNLTSDEDQIDHIIGEVEEFLEKLPEGIKPTPANWKLPEPDFYEAFIIPSQVNYVAMGAPLNYDEKLIPGWFLVVLHHIRTTWLWDKIRVQGGAYGAHCASSTELQRLLL